MCVTKKTSCIKHLNLFLKHINKHFNTESHTKKKKKMFLSFIVKSKQHVHYNLGQFNTNYIIFRNLQFFTKKITSFLFLKDNEKSDEIFENIYHLLKLNTQNQFKCWTNMH
jgi:hypothetical protein